MALFREREGMVFQKVEIKSSVLGDVSCRWLSDIHVAV